MKKYEVIFPKVFGFISQGIFCFSVENVIIITKQISNCKKNKTRVWNPNAVLSLLAKLQLSHLKCTN